jgi:hypothetical protein
MVIAMFFGVGKSAGRWFPRGWCDGWG